MVPDGSSNLPGWARVAREKGSRVKRRVWVSALAALLVISCCTWWVHLSNPAAGATLTLVPKTTHLQQTLSVIVFTQDNPGADIQGRALSYTM